MEKILQNIEGKLKANGLSPKVENSTLRCSICFNAKEISLYIQKVKLKFFATCQGPEGNMYSVAPHKATNYFLEQAELYKDEIQTA